MLILTRNIGKAIKIGDNIEITVLGIDKDGVRFGVEAPKEIKVHREEIYKRIQEQKTPNKPARI